MCKLTFLISIFLIGCTNEHLSAIQVGFDGATVAFDFAKNPIKVGK